MADVKTEPATTTEHADYYKRVHDLEYALTKTRDALRVITCGLEDMAERHATPDTMKMTQEDVSALYGTVTLLDYVTRECDRAYWEGARE